MNPEQYARVKQLVAAALACPEADRRAYLATHCGLDPITHAEAESLLAAVEQAAPLYEHPTLRIRGLRVSPLPLEQIVSDDVQFGGTARYIVRRQIGAGGMGVVYDVHDSVRNQIVALKTLRRLDADSVYQLKREFRNLADVAHPNLVALYDLHVDDDHCFFTMELVEGDTFVDHVRQAGADTEKRLRRVLPQLIDGVEELHRRGMQHRDLKPSNVLVNRDGRVVILDFGLTSRLLAESVERQELAGTPAYLSPEQCLGQPGSNASDWYAVGAMLYHALTGRPAFEGPVRTVIRRKTTEEPPPLSRSAPDVPPDLAEVCTRLLQRDPAQRLTGREASRRLAASDSGGPAIEETPRTVFVGRTSALETLGKAFAEVKAGGSVSVAVHGPSGIGKSALIRRFIEHARAPERVLVLRGRCHEHESIPYKGLDGVVDAITRHLSALPVDERAEILPDDLGALAALFPVLRALAREPSTDGPALDPIQLRRRAFLAFRELLGRLGSRQPLILEIDDFHWADADTVAGLTETLRPPAPTSVLIVISFRSEELDAKPFLRELLERVENAERLGLSLEAMSGDEVRQLVEATLPVERRPPLTTIAAIVRDSSGNPFLAEALTRHVASGATTSGRATLGEMLVRRFTTLPEQAAVFVEALSLCGRAVRPARVYEACGFTGDERPLVARLRAEHLIRNSRSPDLVEVYHDRIRETLAARVAPETARQIHAVMARVLVAHGDDEPESLFEHYRAAGETERAAAEAAKAAAKAAGVLAFDLAATFYRHALSLHPDSSELGEWTVRLAAALENAGRPVEAADVYLDAANQIGVTSRLECRRKAAELLLVGGQIDRGLEVSSLVLDTIGMRLARGPRTALASLVTRRLQLRWRGLDFTPRDESQIAANDLLCIDAAWAVSAGLAMVDPIRAAAFNVRQLLRALDVGESYRIARAMALEAGFSVVGIGAGQQRSETFSRQAEILAARAGHHYVTALTMLWEGIAGFLTGQWKKASNLCGRAAAILREECTGVIWELNMAHNFFLGALVSQGELRDVARHLPGLLQSARERGNSYLELELSTRMILVWLAADDPDGADRRGNEGISRWSQRGFQRQHYNHVLMRVQSELYRGNARAAWQLIEACQRPLRRSLFLRVQHTRVERANYRGRCALAMAAAGIDTPHMLSIAGKEARRLQGEHRPWSDAFASLLLATVEYQEGDVRRAIDCLTSAIDLFDATGMRLYAAVSRRRLASLVEGDRARRLRSDAEDWMAAQGVRNPSAMTRLIAPGLPD